jgi:hypothetical protein
LPQPACEPVFVTVAPMMSTMNMPIVAAAASQRAAFLNLTSGVVMQYVP